MDARQPHRDHRDRQVIAAAIRAGAARADLAYTHRGSSDELLLGLPDAFGWAWGAGRGWMNLVDHLVTEITA